MSDVKEVQIVVKPVAARIGAEISGVKLSGNLDADTIQSIHEAILKHKVVFFRDQDHLDDKDQEAFARLLGSPVFLELFSFCIESSSILNIPSLEISNQ